MHIFVHALIDTLKLAPLIFIVHLLIEIFERKTYQKIKFKKIMTSKVSPLFATGLGLIPQCGFSVIATNFYVQKKITLGALLAVYVATSDEAIPILLSDPANAVKVLPLILIKAVMALIIGFGADLFCSIIGKHNPKTIEEIEHSEHICHSEEGKEHCCTPTDCEHCEIHKLQQENNNLDIKLVEKCENCPHHHCHEFTKDENDEIILCGCHDHEVIGHKGGLWSYLSHPLKHTGTILIYIFIVNLVLGGIMHFIPRENINHFLSLSKPFEPFLAGLIGLIPNCSASVLITQFYSQGFISLGSCVSGLSVNAGLGIAVLIKDNKPIKNTIFIIIALFLYSTLCGMAVNYLTSLFV